MPALPMPAAHALSGVAFCRRCLRGRHVHEYNFEWMRQFMAAYDGKAPWLLLSTFHEAHEGGWPAPPPASPLPGLLCPFPISSALPGLPQ